MLSNSKAIQLISDIICFEENHDELKTILKDESLDWDVIVKISSEHLILSTLYCRLIAKKLEDCIPLDLLNYLEELTTINRNRNLTLLSEAKNISKVFSENNINHVFLKGIALAAGGYYDDIGERMIGDIDVLVDNNQLSKANLLLTTNGYSPTPMTFGSKYLDNKHLPRLTSKIHLGAVEIHKRLLVIDTQNLLISDEILDEKTWFYEIPIPKPKTLFRHAVLNQEINNHGTKFHSINLRSAYDTIVLRNRDNNLNLDEKNKYLMNYIIKLSPFFKIFDQVEKNYFQKLSKSFLELRLKSSFLHKFHFKYLYIKQLIFTLVSRITLFCKNKNYRKDVIKDRKRIYSLLFSRKIKLK